MTLRAYWSDEIANEPEKMDDKELKNKITEQQQEIEFLQQMVLQASQDLDRLDALAEERRLKLVVQNDELEAAKNSMEQLFDAMRQAIVAFDAQGNIVGRVSKAAKEVFNRSDLSQVTVDGLLFPDTDAEVSRHHFTIWRERIFAAAKESVASQIEEAPRTLCWHRGSALERHFLLEFRPIWRDDGLERLMLLATDQTETKRLEREKLEQQRSHERAMRRILDNVTFGFLLVDSTGEIQPGVTNSCRELLDRDTIVGTQLTDALGLDEEVRQNFELSLDDLFEEALPEELALDQFPQRFELSSGRILRIEPRSVHDEQGAVASVLMTLSDISALEQAQHESEENRRLLEILRCKEAFCNFLDETQALLREGLEAVRVGDQTIVRRAAHTIKGNSASYGLRDVAQLVHQIEDEGVIERHHFEAIRSEIVQFLDRHAAVLNLGLDRQNETMFVVSEEQIGALETIVSSADPDTVDAVETWLARTRVVPIRTLLGPLERIVFDVAARLGKTVRFRLLGADTLVDPRVAKPVIAVLPQLLRNAVDHGIEFPGQRGDKDEVATISVHIEDRNDEIRLTVGDDGLGIDDAKVLQRAIEFGELDESEAKGLSREDILGLVFRDRVSSATTVTDISGRGMGLATVWHSVLGLGGHLLVDSHPGQGTRVTVVLPARAAGQQSRSAA